MPNYRKDVLAFMMVLQRAKQQDVMAFLNGNWRPGICANSVLASLGSVVESSKQFRCLYRAFILLNQIATAFMLPSWADICKFERFPH